MPAPFVPLGSIRQPAFLYDTAGRIAAANDLAEILAGRSLAGLSTLDVVRIFRPRRPNGEPLAPAELPATRALAGGEAVDVPFAVTAADGRTVHVLATASPVRDGDAITGALAIWQDVAASVETERDLEESRAKYRALIETAPDFVWEMDTMGRYTYCSPQMERLWGIDPAGMIGRTPFDLMPPDERERALAAFVEMARNPAGFSGLEAVSRDGRGDEIALEINGIPFFSDDGTLLGYRGVTRDVTERRRAGEALRESEADARSFFENMVDACAICEVVVDERGEPVDLRLVDVNPAFERTLSLPADLLVGQTAFMILPTLYREWLDLFLEVSQKGVFVAVEEPFPALDRWFHVTGFPVRHGRVAVVFRDITAERKA